MSSVLRPFVSCEQTSKFRTLRRKPVALAPASVAPKIPLATTRFPIRGGSRFTARPITARPAASRPDCLMDIVFLMDFSGGAIDKREKYVNIASEMIRNMNLGDLATQIAFVRYSGLRRTDSVFHLRKHRNTSAAIDEIAGTPSLGGTTRTGAAMLDAAREFDPRYGGRVDAQKFMVVFTDAYSQDDPVDASAKLYKERIKVLAVAVDDSSQPPDHEQLKAIATDPKVHVLINHLETESKYIFFSQSFWKKIFPNFSIIFPNLSADSNPSFHVFMFCKTKIKQIDSIIFYFFISFVRKNSNKKLNNKKT